MRLAVCLSLLLTLTACQPGDPVAPRTGATFAVKDASVTHGSFGRTDADREYARTRFLEGDVAASRALHDALGAGDWRDADRALRAFLADAHPDAGVQSRREARVASGFLPGHLVNAEPLSTDRQAAIAHYATLAIENRAGQALVHLGPALDRLDGYWPAARLAEAGAHVAAAQRDAEQRRRNVAEDATARR